MMARLSVPDSVMEPVEVEGVQRAFIVRNTPLERLLFDRNLIGLGFESTCEACSVEFVRHFEDELSGVGNDVAELVILSKGLRYGLGRAFATNLHRNLETNLVATRRVAVDGRDATVQVLYEDFDAGHPNILVGDTIASGATICAALGAYLERWSLSRVFVFTFAGSGVGGRRIGAFCRQRGIDLTIAYGLAMFGLAANGFDLSFLTQRRSHRSPMSSGPPSSSAGNRYRRSAGTSAPRRRRSKSTGISAGSRRSAGTSTTPMRSLSQSVLATCVCCSGSVAPGSHD
jgi:hypothetical protein